MNIPTMSFEILRDIIASPDNVYNIENNGYKGDNQSVKNFVETASKYANNLIDGKNLFEDNSCNKLMDELSDKLHKNTPAVYKSDESRRG
jgi:hypothetical protein